MPEAAVAVAGNLIGGAMQADAAESAADTQAQAAADAIAEQRRQYDLTRQDLAPYRDVGVGGLNMLARYLGINPSASAAPASTAAPLTYDQIRQELLPQYTQAATEAPAQSSDWRETGWKGSSLQRALLGGFMDDQEAANSLVNRGQPAIDETGLEAAIQQRLAAQSQAQTQAPVGPQEGDPEFGSLLKAFSDADFSGDGGRQELERLGLYGPFTAEKFQVDPGYQFRQDQGEQAINRAAAAAGRYDSGRALKDLTTFNSGLASQEYGNAFNRYQTEGNAIRNIYTDAYNRYVNNQDNIFNRLAAIAGIGQTATNQVVGQGASTSNNIADLIAGKGNVQAAGQIGAGNAWGNALGGATNALTQYAGPSRASSYLPQYAPNVNMGSTLNNSFAATGSRWNFA